VGVEDQAAGDRVLGPPTLGGSSLALLFWWQSLTPTLIPRSREVQTTIGAVCLAIGYGIGALVGHCAAGFRPRQIRALRESRPGSAGAGRRLACPAPVTFWSIEALWWPAEWMSRPRGFDVPDRVRWFPIVSGVQAVGDMLGQLGPPPGFGHVYSTDYVKGWVSAVPPDGWGEADSVRLERLIDNTAGGESEP